LLILLLAAAAWRAASMREPIYQGKTLSTWLEGCDASKWVGKDWQTATNAVRQIGTNSFPSLLRKLRRHDSELSLKLVALAKRQHFIKIRHIAAEAEHHKAAAGFEALGSEAKGAVPGLIRVFEANISADSQSETATSLGWIGPAAEQAVPCLLAGATSTNREVRRYSVWALGQIHSTPDLVVPALAKALSDPDFVVRLNAVDGLRAFGMEAKRAIPQLVNSLDEIRINFREKAVDLLAAFGVESKSAVPKLLELLSFPNEEHRIHITAALESIDPDATAKAGLK
jgi:HEAT repeat protein